MKKHIENIVHTKKIQLLKDNVDCNQTPEKPLFEKTFSYLLNNQSTIEQINIFLEEHRDRIIGDLIEYLILFPNSETINEYLDSIKEIAPLLEKPNGDFYYKKAKIKILIKYVARKLSMRELESIEAKEKVYKYFLEQFIRNGYYFHSFNGAFEESIRKNGLDTNMRQWDWKELNHIKAIFSRVGEYRILGWGDLNCQGKISIADETKNIYRYGVASPEWFAQFTSEGWHIPAEEPYDKKAFYKRDYYSAKKNIIMLCKRLMSKSEEDIRARKAYPNITIEEMTEILKFFEKYWKILATENSSPKCALIKRSSINRNTSVTNSYQEYCKLAKKLNFDDYSLERSIDMLISSKEPDTQLQVKISPEDIIIINLPEYSEIHKD